MIFFQKTFKSFKRLDHRLFWSLFVMGICPSIYTTVRIFFLGGMPNPSVFSISAQLEWVNLLFEIVNEGIILPLFFIMGAVIKSKEDATNKAKVGLLLTGAIYIVFSSIIIGCVRPMLQAMHADPTTLNQAVDYIRIEATANIPDILYQFALVILVAVGKDIYVYIITGAKMVFSIIFDTFLTSTLSCSANLGINGVAINDIIVNTLLFATVLILLVKESINIFKKQKLEFGYLRNCWKQCLFSATESLVRNAAFILMVARMLNVVSEAGTYWVADSFIWAWLVMPVSMLGELIKQNIGKDKDAVRKNTLGYFFVTLIIVCVWLVTIPAWKPFIQYAFQQEETDKIFNICLTLVGFYIMFAFGNVMDMIFYGLGKIEYELIETTITNIVYYGLMFILYKTGVWQPTLMGITLMFGLGCGFDMLVTIGAYIVLAKKYHLNILDIDCKLKNYNTK